MRSWIKSVLSAAALSSIALLSGPTFADTLPQPRDKVILTVSGSISITNESEMARFDADMLAQIGNSTISTSTTWTDGKPRFTGILGRDLMKAVGASGSKVHAIAINDYKIDIPISDFNNYDVILATHMNGEKLSRRDKGPIWVVYPRDDHAELRNELTDSKSIWQLVKVVVE